METCKICNKELKTINAGHLATHQMTVQEYKEQFEGVTELSEEEITEVKSSASIKPKEVTGNIFGNKEDTTLLVDFLSEYGLTKSEVVSLIENYKDGKRLPTTMTIVRHQAVASAEVKQYLDKEKVEVHSVYEAEELEKHGFKTTEVRSGPPKTWVLFKQ